MSAFGAGDLDKIVRKALLDALTALEPHLGNLVLIGAQAVYLHTGSINLPLAATTSDADLLLDSRSLASEPEISQLLRSIGFFEDDVSQGNPGHWLNRDGIPLDLMQPRGLSSRGKSARAASIPPHSKRAVRIADGLDCALVDQDLFLISSFELGDTRNFNIQVAGPAALLMAKSFKIYERSDGVDRRLLNKDALDILRILSAVPSSELANRFKKLATDPLSRDEAKSGLEFFSLLFAESGTSLGNQLIERGLVNLGDAKSEASKCHRLARQLLDEIQS